MKKRNAYILAFSLLYIPSLSTSLPKKHISSVNASASKQEVPKKKNKKNTSYTAIIKITGLLAIGYLGYYFSSGKKGDDFNEQSHLSTITDKKEIIKSIVECMFRDPCTYPRKSDRAECVTTKESFFSSNNAYKVFLESVKYFGSIEKQKERLVSDALNINYTKVKKGTKSLQTIWEQKYPLPGTFDSIINEVKALEQGFVLKEQYIVDKQDNQATTCLPAFAHPTWQGGVTTGALAWEEKLMLQAPSSIVMSEYIKKEALEKATKDNRGKQYAIHHITKLYNQAYLLQGITLYQNLNFYGSYQFNEALQKKITPCNSSIPTTFNTVFAAAPNQHPDVSSPNKAYTLSQMQAYWNQCYVASKVQTDAFSTKDNPLYMQVGGFGAGAFHHDLKMPSTVQLLGIWSDIQRLGLNKQNVRIVFYPYDRQGSKGLEDGKAVWDATVQKFKDKNTDQVSAKEFCTTMLEVAKNMNKSFKFKLGNGT